MGQYNTDYYLALVRRHLCRPVAENGGDMYEHRTTLQVIGLGTPPHGNRAIFKDVERMYAVICKCERCYVFEEVRKTPTSFAMPEPMMNGILKILQATGYNPHTSTSVSNPDGSVTTTWMCSPGGR